MNSLPVVLIGIATLLLLDQVRRLHLKRRRAGKDDRPAAWPFVMLTFLFGLFAVFAGSAYVAGTLVHSVEFGLVMVQGRFAPVILGVFIVAISVSIGVVWSMGRASAKPRLPPRWSLTIPVSTAIGMSAWWLAANALSLPSDPPDLRVYSYDLWWPPLVLWVATGTVISAMLFASPTLGELPVRWRLFTIAMLTSVLSIAATLQPQFQSAELASRLGNELTQTLWLALGVSAVAAQLAVVGWIGLHDRPWIRRARWTAMVLPVAAFAVMILILPAPRREHLAMLLMTVSIPGGLVAVISGGRWLYDRRTRLPSLRREVSSDPALTVRHLLTGVAFAIAIIETLDLFYFAWFPVAVGMSLVTLACAGLAMAIANAGGPLGDVRNIKARFAGSRVTAPPPAPPPASAPQKTRIGTAAQWLWVKTKKIFAVNSFPVMISKLVGAVLILLILDEIPHAGQMVIAPFRAYDKPALGDIIADKVFARLRVIYSQLGPDVLLPESGLRRGRGSSMSETETEKVSPFTTGPAQTSADAALGKAEDLTIGSVHIPLQVIAHPILTVVRGILRIRTVSGVVHVDRGYYRVLMTMPGGETWVDSIRVDSIEGTEPRHFAAAGQLDSIAERIAFRIVSDSRGLAGPGMTTSWDAFQHFRRGSVAWQAYANNRVGNVAVYDSLSRATAEFRLAIMEDPFFAVAYYRLGNAFAEQGFHAAAIEAFRASLRGAYTSTAANALAYELASLEGDTAAARVLWQDILTQRAGPASPIDQAAAFFGLCDQYSSTASRPSSVTNRLAYFYCKRAGHVYAALPYEIGLASRVREVESRVRFQLGDLVQQIASTPDKIPVGPWSCDQRSTAVARMPARLAEYAADYFRRSEELGPENIPPMCRHALAKFAAGDTQPLREAAKNFLAHRAVADQYWHKAVYEASTGKADFAARDYRIALAEYDTALARRPHASELLNDYAFIVWDWRHRIADDRLAPSRSQLILADQRARGARDLALHHIGDFRVTSTSTLAEVLLAAGRPHEAWDILDKFVDSLPQHPFSDDVRLDLARAGICAAAEDRRFSRGGKVPSDAAVMRARAEAQLRLIRSHREVLRSTVLDDASDELSPNGIEGRCHSAPVAGQVSFALALDLVDRSPNCGWTGLITARAGSQPPGDIRLRVFGSGLDTTIDAPTAKSAGERVLWFLSERRNTHRRWFAELVDANDEPVSNPIAITTENLEGCARNVTRVAIRARPDLSTGLAGGVRAKK